MVWGYLLGLLVRSVLKERRVNRPLLLFAGAIPDLDLIPHIILMRVFGVVNPYGTLLGHHGIAHSWLAVSLFFVPFILRYGKSGFAYLVASVQHIVYGDFLTNEVPLIFPYSLEQIGIRLYLSIEAVSLEVIGMTLFLLLIFKRGDPLSLTRGAYGVLLVLAAPVLFLGVKDGVQFWGSAGLLGFYAAYGLIFSALFLALSLYTGFRSLRSSRSPVS